MAVNVGANELQGEFGADGASAARDGRQEEFCDTDVDADFDVGDDDAAMAAAPAPLSPRIVRLLQLQQARAAVYAGQYDTTSHRNLPTAVRGHCALCRRSFSHARQAACPSCGSLLWMSHLESRRDSRVQLLNPDYAEDDAIGRRFSLLEID